MTADLFDVFDDYADVVAVPLEQALQEFREYVYSIGRDTTADIKSGTSTAASRKAIMDRLEIERKRVELQLFRSIMVVESKP